MKLTKKLWLNSKPEKRNKKLKKKDRKVKKKPHTPP